MLLSAEAAESLWEEERGNWTKQTRGNTGGKEGINVPCELKIACKKTA